MDTIRFRLGRPLDARAIGVLARRVARQWILPEQTPEAGAVLLAGMSAQAIRQKMAQGQRFHLACVGEVVVGVAAMRNDSHLVQFFVGTRYQGRGISRHLWQRVVKDAQRRADTRRFTLNATRVAIPVYLRFGFVPTAPETTAPNGIVATPMQLDLPATQPVTTQRRQTSR
ncbi:GNAT family N-acetyltransferase [Dyella sp. 20L07]|uniref:GNAT family N-acetyltransferase n=1 Tax=Dyella sp. 20L07 TaxID=3384240 RepID=UPI003D283BFD